MLEQQCGSNRRVCESRALNARRGDKPHRAGSPASGSQPARVRPPNRQSNVTRISAVRTRDIRRGLTHKISRAAHRKTGAWAAIAEITAFQARARLTENETGLGPPHQTRLLQETCSRIRTLFARLSRFLMRPSSSHVGTGNEVVRDSQIE